MCAGGVVPGRDSAADEGEADGSQAQARDALQLQACAPTCPLAPGMLLHTALNLLLPVSLQEPVVQPHGGCSPAVVEAPEQLL
jgi:hypothetical protein